MKNKSVVDTFKVKMQAPWVWLVIVLTIGLTVLFYESQKPQMVLYNQNIKSLSEYQTQEISLMRSMEKIRMGRSEVSAQALSQIMVLREMSSSFSKKMQELYAMNVDVPPIEKVSSFEREVSKKISFVKLYLSMRHKWFVARDEFVLNNLDMPVKTAAAVEVILDSASAGFPVIRPQGLDLPDSISMKLDSLLNLNIEQSMTWERFDNDVTILCSEDLIQFFQRMNIDEIALKSKIPLVFYFLSIVLLLSTFFFMFRSRV